MSRYRLAPQADADLRAIYAYLSVRNVAAADRLADRLHEKFGLLAQHSQLGETMANLGGDLRGFVCTPYLILYRQVTSGIEIARVIHAARDILEALEDYS